MDYLISRFKNENIAVVYIYFDYTDLSQTAVKVVACLLRQLVNHVERIPSTLIAMHDEFLTSGKTPDYSGLLQQFIICAGRLNSVYTLIDALDECDVGQQEFIVNLVRQIGQTVRPVLVTSRPHLQCLRDLAEGASVFRITANDDDVKAYLFSRLANESYLAPEIKTEITNRLIKGAQGMYNPHSNLF